jgi:hypothetical protein
MGKVGVAEIMVEREREGGRERNMTIKKERKTRGEALLFFNFCL